MERFITVSAEKTLRYERKLQIGIDISEENADLLLNSDNDTVCQYANSDEFDVLENIMPDSLGHSDVFESVYAQETT